MLSRLRDFAGLLSAALLVGGVAVSLGKWANSAAQEIVPTLLAASATIGAFTVAFAAVGAVWVAFTDEETRKDPAAALGTAAFTAFFVVVGVFMIRSVFTDHFVHTARTGHYEGNRGNVIPFGVISLLVAAMMCSIQAVQYRRDRAQPDWAPRGKRRCPDCAEYPKAEAKVCRYCGYRFRP
jgi:cytochrome bd-type quinol oxidase subunit 2